MRKYKKELQEKEVVDKICCNQCGELVDEESAHQFKLNFGYYSNRDLERWDFDLCENCLEKVVGNFKVPIEKTIDFSFLF